MINAEHLRMHVVRPALQEIGHWSDAAENLVLGTAAQESRFGFYLVQIGGGPALGIFQMEPQTHDDIAENFLKHRRVLRDRVAGGEDPLTAERLAYDLRYAAKMCRVHYLRKPGALPAQDDVEGMAAYWKRHYNTHLGAGKKAEFIENYHRYVKGG